MLKISVSLQLLIAARQKTMLRHLLLRRLRTSLLTQSENLLRPLQF